MARYIDPSTAEANRDFDLIRAGFSKSFVSQLPYGSWFPRLNITGYQSLGRNPFFGGSTSNMFALQPSATRFHGARTFKFGLDMRGANGQDWGARGSRRYIAKAVEGSLRRLGTDYIDLYQMHEPDPDTPIGDTLAALDELVRAGKVRYLGNSNFAGWQLADADWTARTGQLAPFVSAQNLYSLVARDVEKEVVPACRHFGLGLLPYFPLASGLLTGKYHRGEAAPENTRLAQAEYAQRLANAPWDRLAALEAYARARGLRLLDVAIGGLAAKPAVTSVIAGATSPDQVASNVAAGQWEPTPDDLAELDGI